MRMSITSYFSTAYFVEAVRKNLNRYDLSIVPFIDAQKIWNEAKIDV